MKIINSKYTGIYLIVIILNIMTFMFLDIEIKNDITFEYTIKAPQVDTYQVFFGKEGEWNEQNSIKKEYLIANKEQKLNYNIPKEVSTIRVDFGDNIGKIQISNINIKYFWKKIDVTDILITNIQKSYIETIEKIDGNTLEIDRTGQDSFVVFNFNENMRKSLLTVDTYINLIFKVIICGLITIGLLMLSRKIKSISRLGREIVQSKELIWNLAQNDFKTRYAGSYLGVFWAFVQPIITVLIYWFVFQVGFKSAPIDDFPFVLWLIAGIVPWFFFSEALMNATNSLIEYSYLVKKVVFKISVLPVVKIISALFVHAFFVVFTILVYALNGYGVGVYSIQIIYYSICTLYLALGITFATSAMILFFRDLGQVINIILQIGMWMTPIMWNYNMVSEKYQWILKINPMYYIVEGYRDTFINKIWFFERFNQTIYFWIISTCLFFIGMIIFKKLKPHFSDVL